MKASWMVLFALGLVLASTPSDLAAQAEFGLKGGVSFGNISNKGVLPGDLGTRTGFAAGVSVGLGTGIVGLGAEALYAQRGLSGDVGDTKLDYIDIPVYLKVQAPTPGISPFGYLGPQVSFEVTCKVSDVDCGDTGRAKTDYAGVVGAGVKFGGAQSVGFSVEGRYVYGLKDLKFATVTSDESFKTRSFLILGGIIF
jgi:Outer membrane protein beta-barrel domain